MFFFQDTSMVYVQVVDVNDNSPEFQHPPYSFYTPEGILDFFQYYFSKAITCMFCLKSFEIFGLF